MAYAAALFADAVLRGLNGQVATECTFVESSVTDLPFFASKVKLSTEGESPGGWSCPTSREGKGQAQQRGALIAFSASLIRAQGLVGCRAHGACEQRR